MPPTALRPRKTPRQRRGWETRARILDAAAAVFAEHGYAAGTTNRIAAAAGMSVGSLYQYFPNKDAILVELVRAHVADGVELVAAILARPLPDAIEDRVALFADALIRNHEGAGRLHQVLFEEAPRPPELLDELHRLEDAAVQLAEQVLGTGSRLVAWMAVASMESLVHRYVAGHDQPDLAAFRAELVRLVSGYLAATRPPARSARRPATASRTGRG